MQLNKCIFVSVYFQICSHIRFFSWMDISAPTYSENFQIISQRLLRTQWLRQFHSSSHTFANIARVILPHMTHIKSVIK